MIVVGGPVRNRAWVVRDHVLAIAAAAKAADTTIRYCYVVGDSSDDTSAALLAAIRETPHNYTIVYRDDPPGTGHSRDGVLRYSMHNLAAARQEWADSALVDKPTHLWAVDSDIIVDPSCLTKLLAVDELMVGANVHLSEHNPNIYNFMDNWRDDQPYRSGYEHIAAELPSGAVQATWVGACVLYQHAVFTELGARYNDLRTANTHPLRMEELGIVRRLVDLNKWPWWVPSAHTQHRMTVPQST